jgi:hypothetical protein
MYLNELRTQKTLCYKKKQKLYKLLRESKKQKNIEEQRSPTISKASTANLLRLN